jgi:hypothetical protein
MSSLTVDREMLIDAIKGRAPDFALAPNLVGMKVGQWQGEQVERFEWNDAGLAALDLWQLEIVYLALRKRAADAAWHKLLGESPADAPVPWARFGSVLGVKSERPKRR